ncbi:predicted protein, partial [Nematostella vectensis]
IGHVDGTEAPKYFRLNQLEGETEFVTQDELDRSRRVKLISLRDQGVPEFKNYKMIPARERDIPANVFEAYEKRQRGEQAEEETEDELCAHRMAVTKFLNKVRAMPHQIISNQNTKLLVRKHFDSKRLYWIVLGFCPYC